MAVSTAFQIAQPQVAHLHSAQLHYGKPVSLAHLTDLAVAALVQRNLNHTAIGGTGDDTHLTRSGTATVQHHALFKLNALLLGHRLTQGNTIDLRNMSGGMHNGIRKIAIVGKQQQSLGFTIQTTDRMYRYTHTTYQFLYTFAAFFIRHGGDITTGFM